MMHQWHAQQEQAMILSRMHAYITQWYTRCTLQQNAGGEFHLRCFLYAAKSIDNPLDA